MDKVKQLKNIDKKLKTLSRNKSFRCPFSFLFFSLREEESKVIYSEVDREIEGIPGPQAIFSRLQSLSHGHSTCHHKGKRYE